MRPFLLWLFIIVYSSGSICQNNKNTADPESFFNNQIELRHDNDFLIFTDRYYTTGSYIEYRYLPENGLFKGRKEQIIVSLEHLYYTPTNIISSNTADFDRPYAGYLGVSAGSFMAKELQATNFTIAVGVTGPISMAEGFQNLFHSSGGISTPPWIAQIKNNFHFNLYAGYIREWMLNPKPFSVYAAISPNIAFGTKDVYVNHEFKFFFGKRNPLLKSLAYNQLGETGKEFFFSINFTYRYVIHNALLEGHLVGDTSEFLVTPNEELFLYGIIGYYRMERNDFKIGYQYISKETNKTRRHLYFTVSVARRF